MLARGVETPESVAYIEERHGGIISTTYYVKYKEDPTVGHITSDSFWHNYNTWDVGIAYKPCVARGRNHHGNLRFGVSAAGVNQAIFSTSPRIGTLTLSLVYISMPLRGLPHKPNDCAEYPGRAWSYRRVST